MCLAKTRKSRLKLKARLRLSSLVRLFRKLRFVGVVLARDKCFKLRRGVRPVSELTLVLLRSSEVSFSRCCINLVCEKFDPRRLSFLSFFLIPQTFSWK